MDFVQFDSSHFSFLTQLVYVLPRSNLHFLPKSIREFLHNNYDKLYPESYDFQWAFCRYFWEAHPILPEINVKLLEKWDAIFSTQKFSN
jgi:5'-3' exonuclease